MTYKLTKKAQADLSALVDFSLERFGTDRAVRHVDAIEQTRAGGDLRILRIYHSSRDPL